MSPRRRPPPVVAAALALGLCLLAPAARAADPTVAEVLAPMLGVWADAPPSCVDEPGMIADARFLVRTDGVEDFVTFWGFDAPETWRLDGRGLRGTVMRGEEGGDEGDTGPHEIRLELFPEGILAFSENGHEPRLLVRCPRGVRVR